jgi:hypothetical protein
VPGHHRGDLRVAGVALRSSSIGQPAWLAVSGCPPGGPGGLRARGTVETAELVQGHQQLDLGRLSRPVRQASGAGEPPQGLFERVVITLRLSPVVFRADFLAQRLQHRLQGGSALGGQVPGQLPRTAVVQVQAD